MVRMEFTAEASCANMRERIKFGMAMAAMIRMIATTISSSMRENPFCFFMTGSLGDANLQFLVGLSRGTSVAKRKLKSLQIQCTYKRHILNVLR